MELYRLFENYLGIGEALTLSQAKKHVAMKPLDSKHLINLWKKLVPLSIQQSKRQDRLYFEFVAKNETLNKVTSPIYDEVSNVLDTKLGLDLTIDDYVKGTVKDKYGRDTKLGKVLTKEAPDLLQQFNNDKIRQAKNSENLLICISKHPYDIAGMSTDRGWSSCMNLNGGEFCEYVGEDIKYNTLIAYLIKEDDLNINRPQARVLIKPFVNVKFPKRVIYFVEDFPYGSSPNGMKEQVETLFNEIQADVLSYGAHKLSKKLYNNADHTIFRNNTTMVAKTRKEIEAVIHLYVEAPYKINNDLTVDVDGSVQMNGFDLISIPFQFGKVTGEFDCSSNKLVSLKGCPYYIGGSFDCGGNLIKNLQYSPKIVDGSFICRNNNISSLQGVSEKIGGGFYCNNNFLVDLEGLDKSNIGSKITVERNKIISLKGCPKKVNGDFNCSYNHLKTLEGAPHEVIGNMSAEDNLVNFTISYVKSITKVKGSVNV